MAEKKTLTTGEIADYCGVNFRTVIRWIKRGHLRAFQLPGRGDNRVEVGDFLSFLKKYRMTVPQEFQTGTTRVLIVDDDVRMANSIQRTLRQAGYETMTAADGFHAGVLLGSFRPDVMTLDIQMPGLSGFDVIKFVRETEAFRNTRILIVSAVPKPRLEEAVGAGADDLLEKPFVNNVLVQKVGELAKGLSAKA